MSDQIIDTCEVEQQKPLVEPDKLLAEESKAETAETRTADSLIGSTKPDATHIGDTLYLAAETAFKNSSRPGKTGEQAISLLNGTIDFAEGLSSLTGFAADFSKVHTDRKENRQESQSYESPYRFAGILHSQTLWNAFRTEPNGSHRDSLSNIFENGSKSDPFKRGTTSDIFSSHGFSFRTIGATIDDLMGFKQPAFAQAGSALDRSSGLVSDQKFNFDRVLNSDFLRNGDNSKAGLITDMSFDKVSSSLSEFFFSKSATAEKTITPESGLQERHAEKSLLGSVVDSVKSAGNTVIEGSKDLISYIFGSEAKAEQISEKGGRARKNPDGSVTYEGRTPDGGRLRVDSTDQSVKVDSTTHGKIDRSKETGELNIQTADGRRFHQTADGKREVSSPHSDLKVETDGNRVLFKDKSGHPIAEFGSAGEAKEFLNNGEITISRQGESVEDAARRLERAAGETWKDNNHIITDGKGNVLIIDEHGNTMRRYPDGRVDMTYRRVDAEGKSSQVDVRLVQRSGKTIILIKGSDGEYRDTAAMTQSEIRDHLHGTDLTLHDERICRRCHGRARRQGAEKGPGEQSQPETPTPLVDASGRVRTADDTTVDTTTGRVTVQQGDNEITVETDPKTGRTTIRESKTGRVLTREENGKLSLQGADRDDVVTFDSTTGLLDAFGIKMDREGNSDLRNPDGSHTRVDRRGFFELFDCSGQSLLQAGERGLSFFDKTYIDSNNEIEDRLAEELERQKEQERQEAMYIASCASAFAAAVCSGSAGLVSPGAIEGYLALIQGEMGKLLGFDFCPEVASALADLSVAESRLRAAKPEFDHQILVQHLIQSEIGTINDSLIAHALHSSSNDASVEVANARRYWTGNSRST